ncbi:MAG: 4-(cytidine 5'-diphospho)-2-C-methyl-D-erythritol kinase [Planctomycetaceae bacterium]|nr:4-(cytidine 5'-diphospho)-2-C-methyl-D-erythritol kinase [Planctomycetaceae bacterium]
MRWKQQDRSLIVESPAKLNLFLEVLGKRSDGYHELESLMVTVDWYDTLRFTPTDHSTRPATSHSPLEAASPLGLSGGSPSHDGPEVDIHSGSLCRLTCITASRTLPSSGSLPAGSDNLVLKAAELLRSVAGSSSRPVDIELIKRIPMAAGLAGGSGNAAAALWALNRLWGLNLPDAELRVLAGKLGSDIAFFLGGATSAVCRGRGEIVEPVLIPAGLTFVVAKPASGLSTPEVFRHCRPSDSPRSATELVRHLQVGRLDLAGRALHNALQGPAEGLNPDVRFLKSAFSQEPVLGHRMSGSGTAWFGLCSNGEQARRTAARLKARGVPFVGVVRSRP